jgi:hypothetical protein
MRHEFPTTCSRKAATGHLLEPDESNSHDQIIIVNAYKITCLRCYVGFRKQLLLYGE